jgi:hypothetical protein
MFFKVVLMFHLKAKVQVGLHSLLFNSSAQLLFAKLPYSKIVAAHHSFKKKPTTIEDLQSQK